MNRNLLTATLLTVALLLAASFAFAEVPQMVNYQGRLTDDEGVPVANGAYLIKFILWDDLEASDPINEKWNSGFQPVQLSNGIFSVQLGQSPMPVLPYDVFAGNMVCYLGITVGVESEYSPRTQFLSVPYAFYAHEAETVNRSRDLYHQIMDVNPNGIVKAPFITHADASTVTLYLYGDEFQGALAEHTHAGNNTHTHDMEGTVESGSAAHDHSYSGTSNPNGSVHTHSGNTHSNNVSHSHSGTTNNDGQHYHDFLFTGLPQNGLFLVDWVTPSNLAAHGSWNNKATKSVDIVQSNHAHGFSTGSQSANHIHPFSTGNESANHTHTYSGTTGSDNITHSHGFTGTITPFGTGLEYTGISAAVLPSSVMVYVDGSPVAGPFDGAFSSGAIDLTVSVTGAGEHLLEIREEGGNGGRITYNLFVE